MPNAIKPAAPEFRRIDARDQRVAREDGKPAKLTGYAATFNSDSQRMVDSRGKPFIERIAPGAFANTIDNADVRALVNHDPNLVVGRTKAGTLRLSEDDIGLRYEVDLPDTAVGRDTATSVERGDMDGCSFGFRTIRDSWAVEDGVNIRTLLEVELIDVGPVTFPAYESTSVDVRSLVAQLAEKRGVVEYDDPSLRWQCRSLISYLRYVTDCGEGVLQAIENYDSEVTDADSRAASDCLDAVNDALAKLKDCKIALKGFGAVDPDAAEETPTADTTDASADNTDNEARSAKPADADVAAKAKTLAAKFGFMTPNEVRKIITAV